MKTMGKKRFAGLARFLTGTLMIVLCAVMFAGCILFQVDRKEDYAQVVAKIQNIDINDPEGKLYSSEITKRDLIIAYVNNNSNSQESDVKTALDNMLQQLVYRELIIAEFERMENTPDTNDSSKMQMEFYQADYNNAWKGVYDYLDSMIQSKLQGLLGDDAPTKGTSSTAEPTYPSYTLQSFEERQIAYNRERAAYLSEEKWTPELNRRPDMNDEDQAEAVRLALIDLLAEVESIKLTDAESARLEKDKAYIKDPANLTSLYDKVMGNVPDGEPFFFIEKMLYQSYLDQERYNKMETYYSEQIGTLNTIDGERVEGEDGVTTYYKFDKDIQAEYESVMASQKVSFNDPSSGLSNYFTALKNEDGNTPYVLYHPTNDFFYVKHILLPFSEEQKNQITEYAKTHSEQQVLDYRAQMAEQITVYKRVNGEDDKTKPIHNAVNYVETELAAMGNTEQAMNTLIYRYNTDSGIFNNEKGYLMPSKASGLSSGYVTAFEETAYELYEKGIGSVGAAITEYGVHVMMYTSRLDYGVSGEVKLNDYTSSLRLTNYRQLIFETLLGRQQTNNFTKVQSRIYSQYTRDDTEYYIVKYPKRYADLYS